MRSRAVIVGGVLGVALVSGGWLVQNGFGNGRGSFHGPRLYQQVRAHVERYYVEPIPDSALTRYTVEGLLHELGDPHTTYLPPERLARLRESTTGRYAGVGVQLDRREGWVVVVSPLPGGPAEKAGLQSGDRIVAINGKPTRDLTDEEAVGALRGTPGTKVSITVERAGVADSLGFTLTRREIVYPPVQHATLLSDGVGYVDLTVFGEMSREGIRRAVDSLQRAGMRSLILDLRGNPGGLLDEGVAVSELFLDPGKTIVSMKGRARDANEVFVDRDPQAFPGLPMVVLVDSGSASASEIVAGALQDHDRAAIVGTTTFGKGSAQSLVGTVGGGAVKITTARWYTPVGRSITRITPDSADDEDGPSLLPGLSPPSPDSLERPEFRTEGGRLVYGGGGITPDLIVADAALDSATVALARALGPTIPKFRDALTAYAIELKGARRITDPAFEVTAEMRRELLARARQRGATVDSAVYEQAAPAVARLLAYEVARYVFGPQGEFARRARDDDAIVAARGLLAGAASQRAVFDRVQAAREARATRSPR